MENRGRRGHRNRCQHQIAPSSFGGKSLLVTAGVFYLTYSMLQHYRNCVAKQELMELTSSVDDMAKQLNTIQNSYQLLEDRMLAVYSRELPKLDKQMAALEALAGIREANRIGWNPRIHAALPYIDVKLIDSTKPVQEVPNENTTKTNNNRNVEKCENKIKMLTYSPPVDSESCA